MLTMADSQADALKIRRLEAALLQSKSEIMDLHAKIRDQEKEKVLKY